MKYLPIFLSLLTFTFFGCNKPSEAPREDIIILFENDVHCALDGYAKFSALRKQMLEQTPYVAVVSAGDFAQGAAVGSITQGESIIKAMNAVHYDAVTIGNHEFDYGVKQMNHLMSELKAEVVCCNFTDLDNHLLYKPYCIKQYGPVKVAFVGVATPTTFNTSTPTHFEDENGNLIYSFHAEDCFDLVQEAVNEARQKGADYVMVLSHLGDDTELDNSVDMIRATTGIDAVFDGHQHHILDERVLNAAGDTVILASTGTAFQRLGVFCINKEGKMTVNLIDSETFQETDPAVEKVIKKINKKLEDKIGRVVGYTEVPLTMLKNGERETRRGETNLSDFLTDVFRAETDADLGIMNGGGIRNQIGAGDITFGDVYSVIPFNNTICKVECTGRQLLDALEVGVALAPEENGNFFHVSGLRYTYDSSIPSSVMFDSQNLFVGVGQTRRILSVEILDDDDNEWEELELDETYTLGGQSYILLNKGAAGAFRFMKPVKCEDCNNRTDVQAVIDYLAKHGSVSATQYAESQGRQNMVK